MTHRYYPSTRERIARALDEGVKAGTTADVSAMEGRYSRRNSGKPLFWAFYRGWWLARGVDLDSRRLPVVNLRRQFAGMIAEIEADAAKWLEGGA